MQVYNESLNSVHIENYNGKDIKLRSKATDMFIQADEYSSQ